MEIPEHVQRAVEARLSALPDPGKAIYHVWVLDPQTGSVHLSDDHDKPRRHKGHHDELAKKVGHHPDRVHGYAYKIRGGWRITDWEHKPVDRYVAKKVIEALS